MSLIKYKLRVDTSMDNHQLLLTFFNRYAWKNEYIFAYEDQSTHPHVHGYFQSDVQAQTLRAFLRKHFGSGNSQYSMPSIRDETVPVRLIAYILKQGQYHCTLPKDVLDTCLEKDKIIKAEIKAKKQARLSVYAQIKETYFKKVFVTNNKLYPNKISLPFQFLDIDNNYISKKLIVKIVLHFYSTTNRSVRKFQILSLCQTLSLQYIPGYKQELEDNILDQL